MGVTSIVEIETQTEKEKHKHRKVIIKTQVKTNTKFALRTTTAYKCTLSLLGTNKISNIDKIKKKIRNKKKL